jgi:hypothetical protein
MRLRNDIKKVAIMAAQDHDKTLSRYIEDALIAQMSREGYWKEGFKGGKTSWKG